MVIFLIAFSSMLAVVLGMSIGLIISKKRLKGSCGGIDSIPGLKSDCSCGSPCDKRLENKTEE